MYAGFGLLDVVNSFIFGGISFLIWWLISKTNPVIFFSILIFAVIFSVGASIRELKNGESRVSVELEAIVLCLTFPVIVPLWLGYFFKQKVECE